MSDARTAALLCALNLAFIAALPRVFFRPGRLNSNWWLTAAPFMAAGVALVLGTAGLHGESMPHALLATRWPSGLSLLPLLAVPLAAASIALIGFTAGSHPEPVSLWHQENDTPRRLVQHGAYAHVRHPFYASFLLALSACVLAAPGALTAAALVFAVLQLRRTAVREEGRLLRSPLGAEYREYMRRTGRFTPRFRYASFSAPERT